MKYEENLNIGLIQTIVEGAIAWPISSGHQYSRNMSLLSERRVIEEIKKGFIDLLNNEEKPHIIILPELSVPLGFEYELRQLSAASGAVVIAGLDFVWDNGRVSNKAIVCVPRNWPTPGKSHSTSHFYFGKTHYSHYEIEMFAGLHHSETSMYILNAGKFGNLGVAICSDFFDIERFVIYKGRIHHLVIIAHNQDTESYYFLSEAISRLVFCNVIICNTGEFGDSIAFSPKDKSYERTIYRHKGMGLFTTQLVKIPVESLDNEQKLGAVKKIYKSKPPGYVKKDW